MHVLSGWDSVKNESSAWLIKWQSRKELRLLKQAWAYGVGSHCVNV